LPDTYHRVAQVRKNRRELVEEYGGVEGYSKHLDEQRPILEKQGWKFISWQEAVRKNDESHARIKAKQQNQKPDSHK
jgi:hypothetical protein